MHSKVHWYSLLLTIALGSVPAFAQTAFEVATIRPSQQNVEFERDGDTRISEGRLRMRDVTLSTCIKWAYGVQQSQIIGTPEMDHQHYDIMAKTEPGTTTDQMRSMLQTLLSERFHLAFHSDKRELDAYAMAVDPKGLKMKRSATEDGELYRQNSATGMVAKNITMPQLANYISGPLGAPLVDDTHLPGRYDLVLDFTSYVDEDREHQASPSSIIDRAFRGGLGLRLTRRKAVVDVMVIDHAEPPSAN